MASERRVARWTEEMDKRLLAYLHAGLSRARIAAQMGVTRNAVCGRAHRLIKAGRLRVA